MTPATRQEAERRTIKKLGRERLNEYGDDEEFDEEFKQAADDVECEAFDNMRDRSK